MSDQKTTVPVDMVPKEDIVKLLDMLGNASQCKACKRVMWWVTTRHGKKMPVTDDAQSHFANCPEADSFRKR